MRTELMDVTLEVPYHDVADLGSSRAAARYIVEKLRHSAEAAAASVGGRVVTDTPPEIVVHRRTSILIGGDWLLMGSRWTVEVPDNAVTPHAR